MFCRKCGTPNPDNAAFCKKCGGRLNSQVMPADKTTQEQSKHPVPQNKRCQNQDMKKTSVAVIVAAVLILAFVLFGGRSYKSTVKQYFDATFDGDARRIIHLLPDKMVDYSLQANGYDPGVLDELIEDISDDLQESIAILDLFLGGKWKATYKIVNVEKVTGSDLKAIQKDYRKMDIKVSAAKEVALELTIKSGKTEQNNTMLVHLIKVGRSWYLDAENMSLF